MLLSRKYLSLFILLFVLTSNSCEQEVEWPQATTETKPGARWWWMGNAVDEANLTKNMEAYAKAGIGSLEITPIYGVNDKDAKEVEFLSKRWMELYTHTVKEGKRLGINIDLNTGTGWPFGGPNIDLKDAASCLLVSKYTLSGNKQLKDKIIPDDKKQKKTAKLASLMAFSSDGQSLDLTSKVEGNKLNWTAPEGEWQLIALFEGNTFQQVKRAAPGGKGLVLNHYSETSVEHYLEKFTNAFKEYDAPVPHNFFNDSYEVYGADWTPGFLDTFDSIQGYKLQDYLPLFLSEERNDTVARIISDYRETLSKLILNNFTMPWTDWAHGLNSKTRNQAHGSPGNLIDIYAAVDVPECEGFGLSDFNIKGLRKDTMTRPNFSDLSMLKYASSAAHISGKKYTSSETFTWLTEHFRTSFSQCKPDLDLMFVSGVNHMNFHGTTYSPQEAAWPGWKFYASIDMSPTNPLWRDADAFCKYISRVQSFLQIGEPDNDFLVYLPIYDLWHEQDGRLLMFDIHKMQERAPEFIKIIDDISDKGYDMDYISDAFIRNTTVRNNLLVTSGGAAYKAMIVPSVDKMPADVISKLSELAEQGAQIVFLDKYPSDVPGFSNLDKRRSEFNEVIQKLPSSNFVQNSSSNYGKGKIIAGTLANNILKETGVKAEEIKTIGNLQFIRRKNTDGYHYFISALKGEDTDIWVNLPVAAQSVVFFNPLNGQIGNSAIKNANGQTKVHIQLKSGESVIMKTYTSKMVKTEAWPYVMEKGDAFVLKNNWQLYFKESIPAITDTFTLPQLIAWTKLDVDAAKNNMGTAVYSTSFTINKQNSQHWLLDLGDVRETARVIINDEYVQTLWSVPYQCFVGPYLKNGLNTIQIEVTGLPANHIASLDREGVKWRKFKEINFVDINYKKTGYAKWETVPAGLNSQVKIIPINHSPDL